MPGSRPVFISGPASWNRIVVLDRLPEPSPHMQFAEDSWETLGGTSAGKALHLAELGIDLRLHTLLGDDVDGRRIARLLREAGVDVAARSVPGASERHLNLMDRRGGRVSLYLSAPTAPGEPTDQALTELRLARLAVLDLAPVNLPLLEASRAAGVPVWSDLHDFDGSAAFHRPFLEAASYVFMNADRIDDPVAFGRAQVARGVELVVCTLGAEGALAVDREGDVHRVSAAPVAEIVDTNGAGDAFMAGFLAATLGGAPVTASLEAGATQAARALGTRHLSPLLDSLL